MFLRLPESRDRLAVAWLALVVAVAIGLRIAFTMTLDFDPSRIELLPDQREYLDLGTNLKEQGRFEFVDPRFDDTVRAFRMPLYPAFVALLDSQPRWIALIQAVIDGSTVLAVMLLARRWLAPSRTIFAGLFVGLNPFLIYFSTLVLSETLFTAMLTWGVVLMVLGSVPGDARRGRTLWWIGVLLLIGSIFARPSAVVLPVLIATASIILLAPKPENRVSIRVPAPFLVGLLCILALFPWALRNKASIGAWTFLTTNGGFTLYDGLGLQADGSSNQNFVQTMPMLGAMNEWQRHDYLSRRAIAEARADPGRIASLAVVKLGRFFSPMPLSEAGRASSLKWWIATVYASVFLGMTLLGLIFSQLGWRVRVLLLLPLLTLAGIHALTIGSLRYRVPAEPLLAIVAASAWIRRTDRLANSIAE